jgi:hypothetical protein
MIFLQSIVNHIIRKLLIRVDIELQGPGKDEGVLGDDTKTIT